MEVKKNLPYSLEVWDGNKISLVGSDIEPVKLTSWDEDILAWDDSRIVGILTHNLWIVHQNSKPIVIEQTIGDVENTFWEAYELPKLTWEVLLNKDIEEKEP